MSHLWRWVVNGTVLAASAVSAISIADAASLPGLPGIQFVPAGEVLSQHAESDLDGNLWFRYPNGERVPFVVSTADPRISNPGDGAFHPVDEEDVVAAVLELPRPLVHELDATIYMLPFPRAGLLASSADDRAIYLSPGVLDYEAHQVHFLVAHEMGHVFQRRYLPNDDATGWAKYRDLRSIEDLQRFHDDAAHADRPREIFAEDFRALFGGTLARGDGSVENHLLAPPKSVPGLAQWMEELAGSTTLAFSQWVLFPNPAARDRGVLSLRGPDDREQPNLSLLDAMGRRVQILESHPSGSGTWTIQLPADLASGSYWVRVIDTGGAVTRLSLRWLR